RQIDDPAEFELTWLLRRCGGRNSQRKQNNKKFSSLHHRSSPCSLRQLCNCDPRTGRKLPKILPVRESRAGTPWQLAFPPPRGTMTPSQAKYWKRRMSYHRLLVPFFAIMFLAGGVPRVAAHDYPTRSVTLIVPFTPAGATDILGRMAAAALEARLGKSFVVENRPGAGQQIGVNAVARAAPDGYTLLVATSSALAINPRLYKKISYDPVKDFQPIAMLAHIPFL